LFDRVIRGQNGKVNSEVTELDRARACRWCGLVKSGEHVVSDEPAFVVFEGRPRHPGRGYFTLVPKAHVSVLTDLPLREMGAVLAGLSRASETVRSSAGCDSVQVRAHPSGRRGRGHLHFYLVPELPMEKRSGYQAVDAPSAFASLADAINH
jgi:diadenosine tetraphosphate (Ap4A) HIT family hydrolase